MDWDDLRVFHEIARCGSLSAAARTLGVNQSTVSRRLRAFEEKSKISLLERSPTGYELTEAGLDMLRHVERMAGEVEALDRMLAGRDNDSSGMVRVTYPLGLQTYITPLLAAFRQEHPEISLEVVSSDEIVSLAQRHADIAIRLSNNPPESLVGRKIGELAIAPYAAVQYLDTLSADRRTEDMDWLVYQSDGVEHPIQVWTREHVAEHRVVLKTHCSSTLQDAARLAMGVCFFPCVIGDADPLLRRIGDASTEFQVPLWLLTHEDLRKAARIRVLLDFLGSRMDSDKDVLLGATYVGLS